MWALLITLKPSNMMKQQTLVIAMVASCLGAASQFVCAASQKEVADASPHVLLTSSSDSSRLSSSNPGRAGVAPAAETVVPAAPGSGAGVENTRPPADYTIQPEDVLQVTVYEEPDLTTKARVTSSGEITLPLLGRVAVQSLTVAEIQEKITRLLSEDYLVNPQVQVFIETYHPRNVFVTGSVNKPGSYPIPTEKPITLMEMIAMAGGFDEKAAIDRTRIIRTQDGKQMTVQVRVSDIIKKGDKSKDVAVQSNDIIFVPESFF